MRATAIPFAILLAAAIAAADSGGPYAFVPDLRKDEHPPTVAVDSSLTRNLGFFVAHWPRPRVREGFSEPSELEWEPVPPEVAPSLVAIGRVGPQRLYAVRYVRRDALAEGSDPAEAILVVADLPKNPRIFHPVFFSTGGTARDHTVSTVLRTGDLRFAIVRRHYAGQGHHVDRIALAWDAERRGYVRRDLTGGGQYWKALRAAGWKPWSRGHSLDEESLTWIHRVYREADGTPVHRVVRVPMIWDGTRFRAGEPAFDPSP